MRACDDVSPKAETRPRRTGRREERRRELARLSTGHVLDAAEAVFGEKGYLGATIREIADTAELSLGGVYGLFPGGKEEIFNAVIARRSEEFTEWLVATLATDGTPAARLRRLVDETVRYYTEHATFYRLFQRAIGGDWLKFEATASDQNWQYYETILEHYAALFREGIETGDFVDDDPMAMAVLLSGVLQSYLAHRVAGLGRAGTPMADAFPMDKLHAAIERLFLARPKGRRRA